MGNLGYAGIDSTYATAVAILRRILAREADRVRHKHQDRPEMMPDSVT